MSRRQRRGDFERRLAHVEHQVAEIAAAIASDRQTQTPDGGLMEATDEATRDRYWHAEQHTKFLAAREAIHQFLLIDPNDLAFELRGRPEYAGRLLDAVIAALPDALTAAEALRGVASEYEANPLPLPPLGQRYMKVGRKL